MRNMIRSIAALAVLGISPAYALDVIGTYVPDAEKVGQGRLKVMLWDVYDAALFAPNGQWQQDQPFALKLSYLRDIEGKKIADRSAEEIRTQGFTDEVKLADWHAQMRAIFPNVSSGSDLTGVSTQSGETVFYSGEQEIGRITDPDFGQQFFNIWLSTKTSAPELRRKLLGQS